MAQRVSWSAAANEDLRRLVRYLKTKTNEEYAQRVAEWYIREIDRLSEHPTKGMVIDKRRDVRRWRPDRHNYLTYTVVPDGVIVKNILAYKLNKLGF